MRCPFFLVIHELLIEPLSSPIFSWSAKTCTSLINIIVRQEYICRYVDEHCIVEFLEKSKRLMLILSLNVGV